MTMTTPECFSSNLETSVEPIKRQPPPDICDIYEPEPDLVSEFSQLRITQQVFRNSESIPSYSTDLISKPDKPLSRFRKKYIIPAKWELFSRAPKHIRPILKQGKFSSTEDYLDIHFNLLREDFVASLRQGIWEYINDQPLTNVREFINVRLTDRKRIGGTLELPSRYLNINWDNTGYLKNGSLLIFTSDSFDTIHFATVFDTSPEALRKGILRVNWDRKPPLLSEGPFLMLESVAYFLPYKYTLKALQKQDFEYSPMKKYFVNACKEKQKPPGYLRGNPELDLSALAKLNQQGNVKDSKFLVSTLNTSRWPAATDLGLENSQYEALKACMTQEFAVIQGPPGTGKTYLGLQLVKLFLANPHLLWSVDASPILVVCYTNHALDQFLEEIIPLVKEAVERLNESDPESGIDWKDYIVRIGGRTKSELIEELNLVNKCMDYRVKNRVLVRSNDPKEMPEAVILKAARIVGMTTTGASIYKPLVDVMESRLVIVEEAAEVLESHIIAWIPEYCEHLILIGDHQQLRPKTADYHLAKNYNLDLSLFERMIMNGVSSVQLKIQHRMRPQICELITPTIYEELNNHWSVKKYPNVLGVTKNLFFIDHAQSDKNDGTTTTKINQHEAEFITKLCRYFIYQGYHPSQITVLATYKGQTHLLQSMLQGDETGEGVRVSTVDGYQGEENDIILLSLVRSNEQNNVGFLKTDNRVCVALSRARHGLYILGDMNALSSASVTWTAIKSTLEGNDAIGSHLVLKCENHPDFITAVSTGEEIVLIPEGGCNRKCGGVLPVCGHECPLSCHRYEHDTYKCLIPCPDIIPACGHKCSGTCSSCYQGRIHSDCIMKCGLKKLKIDMYKPNQTQLTKSQQIEFRTRQQQVADEIFRSRGNRSDTNIKCLQLEFVEKFLKEEMKMYQSDRRRKNYDVEVTCKEQCRFRGIEALLQWWKTIKIFLNEDENGESLKDLREDLRKDLKRSFSRIFDLAVTRMEKNPLRKCEITNITEEIRRLKDVHGLYLKESVHNICSSYNFNLKMIYTEAEVLLSKKHYTEAIKINFASILNIQVCSCRSSEMMESWQFLEVYNIALRVCGGMRLERVVASPNLSNPSPNVPAVGLRNSAPVLRNLHRKKKK